MTSRTFATHEVPRSPELELIETAFKILLPHAVYNVRVPHNTPLRWTESRMENEHLPSLLGLRVRRNPDDGAKPGYGIYRGVTFCRSLPLHKGPNTNVWDCSIQEPVRDDSNATYHATTLGIGDDGKATLDRTWYFVDPHDTNPDDPGKKVQEQRYGDASAKEYQEYWGYMRDGLLNVIQTAPTAQELFLAEKNIDPVPMRFAALGSITSKAVLVYL